MPKSTHGIQASDSLLSQFYKRGKFLTFKNFMHKITLVPEVYFSSPLRNENTKNKSLEPG
jgi:hypothetical protein